MATRRLKRRTKIDEPFDTKLADEKGKDWTTYLVDELEAALSARSELMDDDGLIDLWHALYGQEPRNRKGPWPGSADLGSYIPTEKVDATRAKLVKIIAKTEPLCIVEGRGRTAENAPIVEAFHEWHQQREEKLFLSLVRWWHQSLIERVGILETYEKIERVVKMEERDVLVTVDPANMDPATGQPAILFGEKGEPIPEKGTDDNFIDAQEGEPQAKVKIKTVEYVHRGPRHRVVSGKDFVWIPAHARERDEEVIGWFKRFYRTNAQLDEAVELGRYDKDAVKKLGTVGTRPTTATETRQNISVEATGHTASQEHELWEGQVFADLDGDGPRWHVVTLSKLERVILRIKDDPIGKCRFTLAVLFPRQDGIDGYSFVGDKLYSLSEEHASERNQITDRSTLAVNAPILNMGNWKPQQVPWAPRAVIKVTDPREITQVKIADVPESAIIRERNTLQAAERVSGAADIVSSGVVEGANPTATQVANSAAYSNARLEEQVTLGQEAIEQLYELRHLMLVRMLEFNEGMEVDASVAAGLSEQGIELADGKITAEQLKGDWRFKPRGSVESADPVLLERKFQQKYASLFTLAKGVPSVAMQLQNPELGMVILKDWAETYKIRDRAPFLKPPAPPPMPMGGPFGGEPMGPGQLPPGMLPPQAEAGQGAYA